LWQKLKYTQASCLTAIEYPTKGKTVFSWENHRFGSALPAEFNNTGVFNPGNSTGNYLYGGLRINAISNYDTDGKLLEKKVFAYLIPDNPSQSSGYLTSMQERFFQKSYESAYSLMCSGDGTGQAMMNCFNPHCSPTPQKP